MSISLKAQLLGGVVVKPDQVLCPGPGHSPKDLSLSVRFSGDTILVHSFAGQDWQDCHAYVLGKLGIRDVPKFQPNISNKPLGKPKDLSAGPKTADFYSIWNEGVGIRDTPAEAYLSKRGVAYSGTELRWHLKCPFGKATKAGCMIALVRNIETGEPQAIHRTAISNSGEKRSDLGSGGRKALGPTKNGAVRLFEPENGTIAVAEGIETSLSIRNLPDLGAMPVWSLLNAGQLEMMPIPRNLQSVWIGVDRDEAGYRAAAKLLNRLHKANIECVAIVPKHDGHDINNLKVKK